MPAPVPTLAGPTANVQAAPLRVDLTASGPLLIDYKADVTITGMRITSTYGDCIRIWGAQRVTITNSEIGPCGGKGIEIASSADVRIINNYIHPEFPVSGCCDAGDGVFAYLSDRVVIQDNVIAYGESNVELLGVTNTQVIGNHLLNPLGPHPRGQQVQVWAHGSVRSSDVLIQGNYALSAPQGYKFPEGQWDAVNVGFADRVTVKSNYISGGRSQSGCGIIVDQGANDVQMLANTLVHTGQCGIGVGSGSNNVVDGNGVYNHGLNLPNVGNTALYVWNQYGSACGPVRFTNNVAVLVRPNGQLASYWNGGGCDPVTQGSNVFDQAAVDLLSPPAAKMPPPPPIPDFPRMLMDHSAYIKSGPGYTVAR